MQNLIFSCIESRIEDNQNLYGCFKLGPFYSNQSLTIANTIRRILLSDLEGLAIVFLKIEGVKHEYSILNGVKESILEILTNIKQIQFKSNKPIYQPQTAYLNIQGPKIISASDIQLSGQIQCINPNQYIATASCDGKLKAKLFIFQGKRYLLQNTLKPIIQNQFKYISNINPEQYLFMDAIFLPISKVNFIIQENKLLSQEFIIFEIWTKGTMHPKQSLYNAIDQIIQILLPFRRLKKWNSSKNLNTAFYYKNLNIKRIKEKKYQKIVNKINSSQFQKKLLALEISNLNLSLQTYIFLKKINIHTISDLVHYAVNKRLSFKDFRHEFLEEITLNLSKLNIRLIK